MRPYPLHQRENSYRLSHISWSSDHKSLLHLHTLLILYILDYGCHICSSSYLDTVHHWCLRLSVSAFRSSTVKSLYAESGLPSLSHCHALLSLRSYAHSHQFSLYKLTVLSLGLDLPPYLFLFFSLIHSPSFLILHNFHQLQLCYMTLMYSTFICYSLSIWGSKIGIL